MKQWGVGGAAAAYIASTNTPAGIHRPRYHMPSGHYRLFRCIWCYRSMCNGNKSVHRNGLPLSLYESVKHGRNSDEQDFPNYIQELIMKILMLPLMRQVLNG